MTTVQDNAPSSPDPLESMRRLEGIVTSAMDGIITVNDAQRIVLFNPAAERMFGILASAAIGEHISRFMPERYRADHAGHILRFGETGVTNRQMGSLGAINGLRADGREFPNEASISQVQVGGERLATVILRDITERRAADEALDESRRRMEGIVESAMDALIAIDDQRRIILFNPAAERMFGVAAGDVIGAAIESLIPERFRAGHAQHIKRFKEVGVTNRRMGALGALSGLRANGEEFPLEASISQVEVGGATIATVILRDITERKANEEARLLLALEVDHRAKNALAVVQAVVSLTRAATTQQFIEAVKGRISALGRAHSVLAQNRWRGAGLHQIIADETKPYERPGQIQVVGPAIVLGPNAVQPISLLIHELATNAVKYGALSVEEGGVTIRIRILANQELALTWQEWGGPPLRPPESSGFGSTLIRELTTRQLGGTLDVDWPRGGMQLRAVLPATVYGLEVAEPPVASPPPEVMQPDTLERGRVLVVEDESLVAMELCAELTKLGWEIVGPVATIEEAALLIAGDQRLDAAILDVNLAGVLVYPIADQLRARGVPFLFCTGYQDLAHHERYSGTPVVRKPVDMQLLAGELHRVRHAA
jgi:PAS domain S-box-containing protein